jgi:manganese-dependent inorganic pyrophosphatase
MPERLVVRITDHHPGGDPKRYPNAEFQNELVGAAATLVAERYVKNGVRVSGTIAQLLQAAIISNTLNFLAPATSERDKRAFAELRSVSPLPDEIVLRMKAARSGILRLSTMAVLVRDNKSFKRTDGSRVAIGQLEADGALTLLERKDLVPSLVAFGESQHASAVVLNLVDTGVQKSAIVTTDRSLSVVLSQRLNVPMDHDGVIRCDRVLQRKTDIVPYVIE